MKKNNYVIIATIFCITTILVTVCANAKPNNSIESNMVNPIHPRLTSITIDPEDVTGQTTNAPGAWTTNLGDPLTQVGVKSDGVFLNQKTKSITLGEIDIQLEPGLNTFELVGNGIFPANTHYGAVLFLDSVATPPQIAVYNENGGSGEFMVQAKDTDIMGGANGGLFFDKAPGTNVFVTEDGTLVEVVSFVINAASSTTDEVSGYAIGSDGTDDMTATLVLRVTPNPLGLTLTSLTIDPEDSTGTTTNAPGAWSTNLADPLSQVGLKSDGYFLNQRVNSISLGEISIPLQPGLNTFNLVGNGVFPSNLYYGAVLFFNGVQTPPQIAVYNENGVSGEFMIQPEGTNIMGSANGGNFIDPAPGTNVFVAEDGTLVEVVSFVINAASSTTDEVSGYAIGSDGTNDMTATLVLRVTLETNVAVENLIDEITSMNLPNGIQNSLTSKLQNALDSLNAPNADQRNDAVNKLNAAINSIEAQAGKKISIEQADYLIAEIQKIIDSIQ